MNLLAHVLAMLMAAARAWWRRFAVANTAGKVFWAALPLLGFCILCALGQAALPGSAIAPTPTPVLVMYRDPGLLEATRPAGMPTEAAPEPVTGALVPTAAPAPSATPLPTASPEPTNREIE